MKKIFTAAVVIVIFAQILFAATAEASASTPPEFVIADAYKAYYEILKAAIDRHGVAKIRPGAEKFEYTDKEELTYAELINFGNDALPSLLYVTGYSYYRECYIYGYSEGKAKIYSTIHSSSSRDGPYITAISGIGASYSYGFEIAAEKNDVKYLYVYNVWRGWEDAYYTVKNGEWVAVLTRDYDLNTSNGDFYWYVNGNLVEKEAFDSAPETKLGIVNTNRIRDNPDAVYAVLAELAEKAGAEMDVE